MTEQTKPWANFGYEPVGAIVNKLHAAQEHVTILSGARTVHARRPHEPDPKIPTTDARQKQDVPRCAQPIRPTRRPSGPLL